MFGFGKRKTEQGTNNEVQTGLTRKDISYKEYRIGDICEVWTRSSSYYKSSEFVGPNEGAIILGPPNIVDDHIDYSDVQYYSWEGYNRKQNLNLEEGDILLAKYAAPAAPFKSAVIKNLPGPAISNPNVIMLKKITCNRDYLQLVLSSAEFQRQLKATQINSTMPSLSATTLLEMKIFLPPRDIQDELAIKIGEYRALKKELVARLNEEASAREKEYDYYSDLLLWNTQQ